MKNKKLFIVQNIMVIIALIAIITITIIGAVTSNSNAMSLKDSYMVSSNIAKNAKVSADGIGKSNLIDGKNHTTFSLTKQKNAQIIIDLKKNEQFNSIILKEEGLNIYNFEIYAGDSLTDMELIHKNDKIEFHRLCAFDSVTARYIKIIVNSDADAQLKEIEVYNEPSRDSDFRVTGYYATDWTSIAGDESLSLEQRIEKINYNINYYGMNNLSHLYMYCGIAYDAEGNVFVGDPKVDVEKSRDALALVVKCLREASNRSIKISYCISSGSNNPILNSAMDKNRQAFIDNLIKLCNEIGFDGIDIDYEFPQSKYDFQTFDSFLIDLKTKMLLTMNNKENALLSCAFGTRDINYSKEAIASIDYVNCMTYDIFDQDGQHSSFWGGCVQGGKYLEKVGFKKEQINIGIPFYGTQVDSLMEQYLYSNLKDLDYYNNTYTVIDYTGKPTIVYFNSPSMAYDKTAYAVLAGYGGVMTWHSTLDTAIESQNSLWKAIYSSAKNYGGY